MLNYFEIGQRIRSARKKTGLSQEELAERTGISITHMSHIETGNTKLSLSVLVDIADILQVSTDSLLFSYADCHNDAVLNELKCMFSSCSQEQSQIFLDIIRNLKISIEKYTKLE